MGVRDGVVQLHGLQGRRLTNLQVVEDPAASSGYKLDVGPFPGWKDVPTW